MFSMSHYENIDRKKKLFCRTSRNRKCRISKMGNNRVSSRLTIFFMPPEERQRENLTNSDDSLAFFARMWNMFLIN